MCLLKNLMLTVNMHIDHVFSGYVQGSVRNQDSSFFPDLQENYAPENSTRHRQSKQKSRVLSIFACINRWIQLRLITYSLFILLPRNFYQLPFLTLPPTEYATTPVH